jgi:hypothetical protein
LDEVVEEGGSVWLAVVSGMVSLPEGHGDELGAGLEVAAGLAGLVHAAVEFDRSGAETVAEHAGVGLAAQLEHAGGLEVGGELLTVEASTLALTAA